MRTATDRKRFVAHPDEKLAAFLELESAIRKRQQTEPVAPDYRLPHIRLKSNKHNGPGTLTLVILGRITLRILRFVGRFLHSL